MTKNLGSPNGPPRWISRSPGRFIGPLRRPVILQTVCIVILFRQHLTSITAWSAFLWGLKISVVTQWSLKFDWIMWFTVRMENYHTVRPNKCPLKQSSVDNKYILHGLIFKKKWCDTIYHIQHFLRYDKSHHAKILIMRRYILHHNMQL